MGEGQAGRGGGKGAMHAYGACHMADRHLGALVQSRKVAERHFASLQEEVSLINGGLPLLS